MEEDFLILFDFYRPNFRVRCVPALISANRNSVHNHHGFIIADSDSFQMLKKVQKFGCGVEKFKNKISNILQC